MAFTHYWTNTAAKNTKKTWDAVKVDVNLIFDNYKSLVQYENNDDHPALIDNKEIVFNGIEDDACETFFYERNKAGFAFCKTSRRPYDLVVMCVLLVLKHHLVNGIKVTSDGEWDDEWVPARDVVKEMFGYESELGRGY